MAVASRVKGCSQIEIQNQKLVVPVPVGFEWMSALDYERKKNISLLIYLTPVIMKSTDFGVRDNWVPIRALPFTVGT